jgi:hypothetical protein
VSRPLRSRTTGLRLRSATAMPKPETLPGFLLPIRTVPKPLIDFDFRALSAIDGLADDEAGGAAPGTMRLSGFGMVKQEQTNWCWVAVTQAILKFLGRGVKPQHAIATHHIQHNGRTLICAPPNSSVANGEICDDDDACQASCNNAHILRIVLNEFDSFDSKLTLGFDAVQAEINAGRPVACRIQWKGSGGHFIALTGWTIDANGKQQVHVHDPADASGTTVIERIVDFAKLRGQDGGYQQGALKGQVDFSYKVK